MLRTAQLLPLTRAFDTALRRRTFPPDAGSLLPGPLAATRTGLAPAGNDELPTESDHVITQPLSNCRWQYCWSWRGRDCRFGSSCQRPRRAVLASARANVRWGPFSAASVRLLMRSMARSLVEIARS